MLNTEASRYVEAGGIPGTATSIITAEQIRRSPGQTVQDVLATVPGVQLQSLYGAVNGAGTTVDLRGFGAFASSNTLFLLNGRRLNDADLQGVDLSTIPLQSIECIEVTRGNSAAVLYGDNAIGGVVNIITKAGGDGKPMSMRVEGGIGSFGQRFGNISGATNFGPWSTNVYASAIKSDGYRANNRLNQQDGVGELRYTTPDLKAYFTVTGDNQQLGLPGARSNHYTADFINYVNQFDDPRGTSTPFDYANKQGVSGTTGFTKSLSNSVDLIVDGGVRSKKQQAGFFGDPASTFPSTSYVDSDLLTWSLTPRLNIRSTAFGMPSTILTGLDYYDSIYKSNRSALIQDPPNHVYTLDQQTLAGYWQQTLGIWQGTDFSYGARLQYMDLSARDHYDPLAPPGSLLAQASPLNQNETNHALHVGLEHRFNDVVTVFGRAAQAFRTPNVDERVVTGPAFDLSACLPTPPFRCPAIPQNFQLKTQTSHDVEGGVRLHLGQLDLQSSVYDMHLKNEIHFDPVNFFNYNLDPTHRYGSETSATYVVSDSLRLRGSFAFTRAVFSDGPFAGNDVPLVSRYSGTAGLSWNVWQRYVMFDATLRAWSSRRFDNDQLNRQPLIPANATIDLKLSGEIDRYYWSAAITNVFSTPYYDYGVASASTQGVFTIYPLPGRVYTLKLGANF